jgi:hypothetical protein
VVASHSWLQPLSQLQQKMLQRPAGGGRQTASSAGGWSTAQMVPSEPTALCSIKQAKHPDISWFSSQKAVQVAVKGLTIPATPKVGLALAANRGSLRQQARQNNGEEGARHGHGGQWNSTSNSKERQKRWRMATLQSQLLIKSSGYQSSGSGYVYAIGPLRFSLSRVLFV